MGFNVIRTQCMNCSSSANRSKVKMREGRSALPQLSDSKTALVCLRLSVGGALSLWIGVCVVHTKRFLVSSSPDDDDDGNVYLTWV